MVVSCTAASYISVAIEVQGKRSRVTMNLVTLCIWPGTYNDREEPSTFDWTAGIDVSKAVYLTLKDNCVAGSERSGYHLSGTLLRVIF